MVFGNGASHQCRAILPAQALISVQTPLRQTTKRLAGRAQCCDFTFAHHSSDVRPERTSMPSEQLNILLIEHDPDFARYLGEMLGQVRDLTVNMHWAADLMAAMAELHATTVDAAMLDLYVPDGAGLANIPLIRNQAPHVPIIAVGESDDEMVALEAVDAGAQDYLVKNQLTPVWLERSIRYSIGRHRTDMALLEAEEKYHSLF